MYERNEDWQSDFDEEAASTGVFGRTLRNLALVVAVCLGIAWLAGGLGQTGGSDRTAGGPPAVERRGAGAPRAVAERAVRARPTAQGTDELVIPANAAGHFLVDALSDGVPLRFLVDTGASTVILTARDAERLGFNPRSLDYTRSFETANGVIQAAPVTLRELRIGTLTMDDVEATVADSALAVSLLGVSFLGRLEGYEVREDSLVLRW